MARTHPLPDLTRSLIAGEVATRLSPEAMAALNRNDSVELREHFEVWVLPVGAITSPDRPMHQLALRSGLWHHQIHVGGKALEFAHSRPHGPNPEDWSVHCVVSSPVASDIAEAIRWIDQNVSAPLNADNDWLARLLIVPAYHLHILWLERGIDEQFLIASAPAIMQFFRVNTLYTRNELLSALAATRPVRGALLR